MREVAVKQPDNEVEAILQRVKLQHALGVWDPAFLRMETWCRCIGSPIHLHRVWLGRLGRCWRWLCG